jgi:DNA-directed RNA polymerase specialized sigma24 family protein
MSTTGSVTSWLGELRAGDGRAAQRLWESYFARLVGLARARLAGRPGTLNDPEDVALSAFNSVCQAAQQGRFPKLDDRRDLWQVLVLVTVRKALREMRRRRSFERMEDFVAADPTPAFAEELADRYRWLLRLLPDDQFRQIAELKLANFTNQEIARKIGRSVPTVERKLKLIRAIWDRSDARA